MAFGYCAGLLARMLRFDPSLTKVIVYRLFSHYIIKFLNPKLKSWQSFYPPPRGVLPYMGYIGMCDLKGYGFSAVLVINRVSILVNFGHKLGMVFVL